MGLLDVIEETKKELEEAIKAEETPEKVEEKEPEDQLEETPEEKPEEKKEEEEKEPEVPNPTSSDFARMRREKKAKEREADQLRRENEELRARQVQPIPKEEPARNDNDPEPDRSTKYESWLEWKDRKNEREILTLKERVDKVSEVSESSAMINAAIQEFVAYEQDFKAITPEYDQAATFYNQKMADSIKMLNPRASSAKIAEMTRNTILQKAALYAKDGLDPAEELFNEAKAFGFTAKEETEVEEKEEKKPDMAKVAANRARNAGTAGAKGRGGQPNITREVAADLTTEEWASLPASEKKRLLSGG